MKNKANNKEHALRYLLLESLARWKSQADASKFLQVVSTLRIANDAKEPVWHIEWRCDGTDRKYDIPKSDLDLFDRGDKENLPSRDLKKPLSDRNDYVAGEFAKIALGLQGVDREERPRDPDQSYGLRCAGYICTALLIVAVELNLSGNVLALGLLIMMFAERSGIGVYVWPVFCLGLFVVGLPFTSLICAAGVLTLGYLDPFCGARVSRMVANVAVAALILGGLLYTGSVPEFGYGVFYGVCVSLFLATWRWLYGSHFGLLPLILPLLASGLFLDGHVLTGSLIAACVAAGLIIVSGTLRIIPYSLHNS